MVSTLVANVVAIAAVIGLLAGVYVYTFRLLIKEIDKDLLADWDRRLALVSPDERDQLRSRPPLEVLEQSSRCRRRGSGESRRPFVGGVGSAPPALPATAFAHHGDRIDQAANGAGSAVTDRF